MASDVEEVVDASPILRLTHAQYETLISHCFDGFPDEACGLLAGPLIAGAAVGTGAEVFTKGQRVKIPSETRLTFTLQQPIVL